MCKNAKGLELVLDSIQASTVLVRPGVRAHEPQKRIQLLHVGGGVN